MQAVDCEDSRASSVMKKMAETTITRFDFKGWNARFRAIVDDDLHASQSWKSLSKAGVDPNTITGLFAFSCDVDESPASRLIEELRSTILHEAKSALRLSARLKSDGGALINYRAELPDGLIEQITEGAKRLQDLGLEARKTFSRHKMNTSFFLSWLLIATEEKTGRPRYRDVSSLLECAYVAYGHELPIIGEEAIRKVHARFMKESPFRNLLKPESRRNLLFAALIFALFQLLVSGELPKTSPLSQGADLKTPRGFRLDSSDEMFRKKDGASDC